MRYFTGIFKSTQGFQKKKTKKQKEYKLSQPGPFQTVHSGFSQESYLHATMQREFYTR